MAAYWRVNEVRVIDDYAVWVRFVDGLGMLPVNR